MIESKPEGSIHLELNAQEAKITWPKWDADCTGLNEINVFAIHRMIQQLISTQQLKYSRIEIAHSPTTQLQHYQDIFQTEVRFNCSSYAFVYSSAHLETLLPQPDEILISLLSQQAEQWLLQQHQNQASLKQRLENILLSTLRQGKPVAEIDILASNFHLSTRSFQRKLSDENIIYRQWLEQLRIQVCIELIEKNDLSFTEIALHLGYADQSSLGRAFKKNIGQTLKAYKQQYLVQHPFDIKH